MHLPLICVVMISNQAGKYKYFIFAWDCLNKNIIMFFYCLIPLTRWFFISETIHLFNSNIGFFFNLGNNFCWRGVNKNHNKSLKRRPLHVFTVYIVTKPFDESKVLNHDSDLVCQLVNCSHDVIFLLTF